MILFFFFFSSRRRHTRSKRDWSADVCSSDLGVDLALFIAISGAVVGPLAWMATTGQSQPEVAVISRSADMLVTHGDPYHTQAQIAPTHDPNSYNPYLPALTVFGLPSAVHWPGLLSDPRLWFG